MILYFLIDTLGWKTFVVNNIKVFIKFPFHINAESETMEIVKARSLTQNGTFTVLSWS